MGCYKVVEKTRGPATSQLGPYSLVKNSGNGPTRLFTVPLDFSTTIGVIKIKNKVKNKL